MKIPNLLAIGVLALGMAAAEADIQYSLVSDGTIGNRFYSDYSISQNNFASSADGGTAFTAFTGNFATDKTLTLSLSAPVGKKFVVNPIAGKTSYFEVYFENSNHHTLPPQYLSSVASLSFTGAEGAVPTSFDNGLFFSVYPTSGTFSTWLTATVPGDFSFTGVSISLTIPAEANEPSLSFTDTPVQGWVAVWAETFTTDPGLWSSVVSVPEPGSSAIIGLGFLAFVTRRSLKHKA